MKPRALAYPDLILFNGKIRSLVAANGIHEAIACAGGRVVATGKSDDIRRLAGPETQSIDLKGRTTIPGLTDTHVHLSEKGTAEMELIDCRDFYTDVHSIADILERLAKRAADARPWQADRTRDSAGPKTSPARRRAGGAPLRSLRATSPSDAARLCLLLREHRVHPLRSRVARGREKARRAWLPP